MKPSVILRPSRMVSLALRARYLAVDRDLHLQLQLSHDFLSLSRGRSSQKSTRAEMPNVRGWFVR